MKESENHVFEYRKNGVTMFTTQMRSRDSITGKEHIYEDFLPPDSEIKERIKAGYRPFLDGKAYVPGKTPRPNR